MVFSETPSVLLGATDTMLALEHEWCDLVSESVRAAGAEPAWNLCVYELEVLQRMADPVATGNDLISSHDTVWCSRGSSLLRDRAAASRLFDLLQVQAADPTRDPSVARARPSERNTS